MRHIAGSAGLSALFCAAVLAGCGGSSAPSQPGSDAGPGNDAGPQIDAGVDAGSSEDAGAMTDAGAPDAGDDAGAMNDAGIDAGAGSDGGVRIDGGASSDAGPSADAGADGGAACTAASDYGDDTPRNQTAAYYTQQAAYEYNADLNADALPDHLVMQLYGAHGVFANGVDAGTFQLSGDELSYATCGLCVYILTDVNSSTHTAADTYFATGGTVTITSVTPALQGTLSGITFAHVTIAADGTTTPVGDGCDSRIDALAFDASVSTVAPTCTAPADYGAVTPIDPAASYDSQDGIYSYAAALDTAAAPDDFKMGLFSGAGVFKSGVAPGTYTIAGAETDISTCGLCLLISTGTTQSGGATGYYFATGGTVDLSTISPTLAGQLTDVTFTHVTFDSSGHMTVVGDCESKIDSLSFSSADP